MHIRKERNRSYVKGVAINIYLLYTSPPTHFPFPKSYSKTTICRANGSTTKMNISFRLLNHNMSIKSSASASDRFSVFVTFFSLRKMLSIKTKKNNKIMLRNIKKLFFFSNLVDFYLVQGRAQSPQHFSMPVKFFSASRMSSLIWSIPSSIRSNCSVHYPIKSTLHLSQNI